MGSESEDAETAEAKIVSEDDDIMDRLPHSMRDHLCKVAWYEYEAANPTVKRTYWLGWNAGVGRYVSFNGTAADWD